MFLQPRADVTEPTHLYGSLLKLENFIHHLRYFFPKSLHNALRKSSLIPSQLSAISPLRVETRSNIPPLFFRVGSHDSHTRVI